MPLRVLVPTDFSPNVERALAVAQSVMGADDPEMWLVHVAPREVLAPDPTGPHRSSHASFERMLQNQLEALDVPSVPASRRVVCLADSIGDGIAGVVVDHRIDRVVLSTHSRTGQLGAHLGRVASSVARRAPCPVITVPVGRSPLEFETLLVAVDFSHASESVVRQAAQVAAGLGATLMLTHVIDDVLRQSYEVFDRQALLAAAPDPDFFLEALQKLSVRWAPGVHTRCRVEEGSSPETLTALAESQGIDLVLMGASGRGQARSPFLGGVAERVIQNSRCPVWVHRASDNEARTL